jgi:hypothetical protein
MDLAGQSRLISNSAKPEWTVLHGSPGFRKAWVGGSNPFVGSQFQSQRRTKAGAVSLAGGWASTELAGAVRSHAGQLAAPAAAHSMACSTAGVELVVVC